MTEYKMFEGCMIGNRIPYIEASSRKVFEKVGIETSSAPFSCCPDPTGMKSFDNDAWLALGAMNLCLAEAENKPIISLCNGCTNTLRGVQHQLKHDSLKKDKVNAELSKIGKHYNGTIDVKHFVDVLKENLDKVKSAITRPLTDLKVACHPGCHYMRPAEWMESDDPLRPTTLKELAEASGASVVDYDELSLCCGNAVAGAYPEAGNAILQQKLESIKKAGANCIVVNCPACFQRMDSEQTTQATLKQMYGIPVLYITELLALAMGASAEEIGLKFHRTRRGTIIENI
jgi:heterodisulfide reductase subunit B